MIDVRGLRKSFGSVEAVRGVSFLASAGQVVGLLGPNGAGKTTTIRMITGFLPPTSGTVTIDGLDTVSHSREVRSRIGYLPESAPLYPEMRVQDYLRYRARLHGVASESRRSVVGAAMEKCRISDAARRRIGHLSKGQRQRVGLAAALLHDPPVLILDEPTSGLDPAQIVEVRALIRELGANKTMILSSHILPEVELTCDRIVIMARGRVRAQGAISDLVQPLRDAARYIVEARPGSFASAPAGREVASAVRVVFEKTPGVAAVHCERAPDGPDWVRLAITPWPDAPDLRESLAAGAAAAGLRLREVRRDTPSLEQLFIRLIDSAGETEAQTEAEEERAEEAA